MTEAVDYAAVRQAGRHAASGRPTVAAPREFLAFKLGAQEYGIDADKVQELRGCADLDCVDDAPEFIAGAMDVRGAMVPIVDLRVPLDLGSAGDNVFTVAIILKLGERAIGIMVDSVSDLIRLAQRQIRPAPASGAGMRYLIGIGTDDDRSLNLLDMEKLILGEGLGLLEVETY